MIFGDIGSGKSSLLLAIINEIIVSDKTTILISGSLAYSPQKPWIMSKTLQENIIFMEEFHKERLQ
jgi:ATP-binding cassette, subfamily C (CFTR/MRP), member 1